MERFAMIDTHAHVHDPAFADDRDAVIARAREAGVAAIVTVGCDLEDSGRAVTLAAERGLWATLGIHPHEAKDAPADLAAAFDDLRAQAPERVVAVGETGLDYHYDHSPRDVQRRVFAEQIRYARERSLPLVFHQREADDDFAAVLREEFRPGEARGLVHCYTGDAERARSLVGEFGVLLGIGGVVTFKTAAPLRDAVRAVGLDALVLETDAPYLAPVPHRGKRNEPAFVARTASAVAELLDVPLDEVVATTSRNARRFFGRDLAA